MASHRTRLITVAQVTTRRPRALRQQLEQRTSIGDELRRRFPRVGQPEDLDLAFDELEEDQLNIYVSEYREY